MRSAAVKVVLIISLTAMVVSVVTGIYVLANQTNSSIVMPPPPVDSKTLPSQAPAKAPRPFRAPLRNTDAPSPSPR